MFCVGRAKGWVYLKFVGRSCSAMDSIKVCVCVYKVEGFVQSKTLLANDGRHLKEKAFLLTNVSLHVIFVVCFTGL